MTTERKWLSTSEVAEYLGVPVKTVRHWRYTGTGPVAYKVGRRVQHLRTDVDEWLSVRRRPASRSAPFLSVPNNAGSSS